MRREGGKERLNTIERKGGENSERNTESMDTVQILHEHMYRCCLILKIKQCSLSFKRRKHSSKHFTFGCKSKCP